MLSFEWLLIYQLKVALFREEWKLAFSIYQKLELLGILNRFWTSLRKSIRLIRSSCFITTPSESRERGASIGITSINWWVLQTISAFIRSTSKRKCKLRDPHSFKKQQIWIVMILTLRSDNTSKSMRTSRLFSKRTAKKMFWISWRFCSIIWSISVIRIISIESLLKKDWKWCLFS